ncbi:MAG: Dabb family protein, partial [Xanthomonadales bacterium]|nr:Dabb family protein [Xanthomonadales bacterium]
ALDAYLVHPTHRKLLKEIMQPLVDRIRVYDVR